MKRLLIFFMLLFSTLLLCPLQAQNPALDRLKLTIDSFQRQPKYELDTNYIQVLNDLAYNFYNYSPDSTYFYGNMAMRLSEAISYSRGMAEGLRQQGISFAVRDEYAKALDCHFKSLEIFERSKDLLGIGAVLNNIGIVYHNQKNFPTALEYYEKSLAIREKLNDVPGINRSLNNIGNIHESMGNFAKALEYHERSLKIKESLGDEWGISVSYNNIGNLHEQRKDYMKAIFFYKKSIAIKEKMQDFQGTSVNLNNIGNLYRVAGDFSNSLIYNQKALMLAKSLNIKSSIKEALLSLSLTYRDQRDFENAYIYFEKFKLYSDSISNESSSKQISELALERKDLENKRLEALAHIQHEKQEFQQLIIVLGACGLLSVIIFAAVIYRNQRKLKAANKNLAFANDHILQKNEEISQQREELQQTLEVLDEQKQIIERKNTDVIASINYAKRIQDAVLPSEARLAAFFDGCFVIYKPKDIVSGDFYWVSEIQQTTAKGALSDIFVLAIADCTGHGVSGAFMTLIGNTLLNQIVNENRICEPSAILTELDTRLSQTLQQHAGNQHLNDGMDITLICWDKKHHTLTLSSAKRPIIYFQKGELHEIKGSKYPIGGGKHFQQKEFATEQIPLSEETVLYLFTDGYTDQFGGEEHKKLMFANFRKKLAEIQDAPLSAQKQQLDDYFERWKGEKKQTDDVLVMGIRFGQQE